GRRHSGRGLSQLLAKIRVHEPAREHLRVLIREILVETARCLEVDDSTLLALTRRIDRSPREESQLAAEVVVLVRFHRVPLRHSGKYTGGTDDFLGNRQARLVAVDLVTDSHLLLPQLLVGEFRHNERRPPALFPATSVTVPFTLDTHIPEPHVALGSLAFICVYRHLRRVTRCTQARHKRGVYADVYQPRPREFAPTAATPRGLSAEGI